MQQIKTRPTKDHLLEKQKEIPLFDQKYAHSTLAADTDQFVALANQHIDRMHAKGLRVGDAFFSALSVFLSRINTEQKHGGPFGAVIVRFEGGLDADEKGIGKPEVIGIGANHVVPNNDPSAHAEMEAYRDAAKRLGGSDLGGTVLYTSCECCPMCLGMANASGIKRIVYTNTRDQAKAIEFSDELQYRLFDLPHNEQMTNVATLPSDRQHTLKEKLGVHGAVVLDANGNVYATGDTDTHYDPTGVASINAIRKAVKQYAAESNSDAAIFCLPEGFTLVSQQIPHPSGLVAADWARILRDRDSANPDIPACDTKTPNPMRIVYMEPSYETIHFQSRNGQLCKHQDTEVTYNQPALPDAQRAIKTEHFTQDIIPAAAKAVFDSWKAAITSGFQARY